MDRLTVLVADSQLLFAQALARGLSREADLEVIDAYPQSGVDAAHVASIHQPSVALLDLWLKGITGPGVVQSIKSVSPATRAVVLGWFHAPVHIQQAFDAGAHGFVSKGLSTAGLVEAVRRVGAGGHVVIEAGQDLVEIAGGDVQHENGSPDRQALTLRELEVLRLLGAGFPVEDVASQLCITRETTRTHVTRILRKTGAHSQLQAIAIARGRGFFP